jgi:hypothetical protein
VKEIYLAELDGAKQERKEGRKKVSKKGQERRYDKSRY